MPANLRRIVLTNQFPDDPKSTALLKDLYEKFLRHDTEWHFFWEAGTVYIRMQNNPMLQKMVRHLKEVGVASLVDDQDWVDNIPITQEFQSAFQSIFHGFSVIAMQLEGKEPPEKTMKYFQLLERIHHCFINMNAHSGITLEHAIDEFGRSFGPTMGEPMALLLMVFRSVFYSGCGLGWNSAITKMNKPESDDLK